jgi:putative FmdB family regulatory protein
MPTYEFFCEKCRKPFTLVLRLAEYEKGNFKCPACRESSVKRQISSFKTKTSKKS